MTQLLSILDGGILQITCTWINMGIPGCPKLLMYKEWGQKIS